MTSSPSKSPLAEKAAELRQSVLATQAPFWLPDATHTLILALLARIFARLEDMIALWAQGILPPPPAPRPRAVNVRRRTRTSSRTARPHRRRTPRLPPDLRPLRIRIWWSSNPGARAIFTLPNPRPRPPRDPPVTARA